MILSTLEEKHSTLCCEHTSPTMEATCYSVGTSSTKDSGSGIVTNLLKNAATKSLSSSFYELNQPTLATPPLCLKKKN